MCLHFQSKQSTKRRCFHSVAPYKKRLSCNSEARQLLQLTRTSKMRLLTGTLACLFALCATSIPGAYARIFSGSAMEGMEDAINFQIEQREAMLQSFPSFGPPVPPALTKRSAPPTFRNPRAREFFVDGSKLPLGLYTLSIIMTSADSLSCQFIQ